MSPSLFSEDSQIPSRSVRVLIFTSVLSVTSCSTAWVEWHSAVPFIKSNRIVEGSWAARPVRQRETQLLVFTSRRSFLAGRGENIIFLGGRLPRVARRLANPGLSS